MRHEPYQSLEGEIYTTSRKGVYTLFQRRNGKSVKLTEQTFSSHDAAKQWVEPHLDEYRLPGRRPFITLDIDD